MNERDARQLQKINDNRVATGRKPMSEEEYFERLDVARQTQEWTRECLGEVARP